MNTNKEFTRSLAGVFGMSLRPASPTDSFAYLENMYVDYEGGGDGIESVPGYKKILSLGGRIHSMCLQSASEGKYLIIHSGKHLYRIPAYQTEFAELPSPFATLSNACGCAFAFGSLAFVNDGKALYLINESAKLIKISEGDFATGCAKMAVFDGRLFLTGNENYPNRVYYSERIEQGGFELSEESYLTVCAKGAKISAILSFDGALWVFKSADDGDGGILRYVGGDGCYASDRVFSGVSCAGEAIAFGGEIIFTSPDGIYAIEQPMNTNGARIACRSDAIAPMLSSQRLTEARLNVWRGYLAVCIDRHIYLLDKRGKSGSDWYYLSGIGGYENDRRVYRYSSRAEEGLEVYNDPHAVAEGEIISLTAEDGRNIYYESREGKKYSLYPTPEMTGGNLLPPRLTLSTEDYLWFSAGERDLFLFNRGDKNSAPDFYSFAGHAPRYMAIYRPDDCDIPELCKSTVGGSLLLKLKTMPGSSAVLKVSADGKEICSYPLSAAELGFSDLDFGSLSLSAYGHSFISTPERASGWREKQIILFSEKYSSPFGLCAVSYRYRIKDCS